MIIQSSDLKLFTELARTQVDTLDILSDENGWTLFGMDPSHVAMVYLTLPASVFTDYAPFGSRVTVDCDRLLKVLKNFRTSVDIRVENGRMTLSDGRMTSIVPLRETPDTPVRRPALELRCELQFTASQLMSILTAEDVPSLVFRLSPQSIEITAQDETGVGTTMSIPPEDVMVDLPEDAVRVVYPASYFSKFLKTVPRDSVLSFRCDTDRPMMLSTSVGGMTVEYLLAPWMVDE